MAFAGQAHAVDAQHHRQVLMCGGQRGVGIVTQAGDIDQIELVLVAAQPVRQARM